MLSPSDVKRAGYLRATDFDGRLAVHESQQQHTPVRLAKLPREVLRKLELSDGSVELTDKALCTPLAVGLSCEARLVEKCVPAERRTGQAA